MSAAPNPFSTTAAAFEIKFAFHWCIFVNCYKKKPRNGSKFLGDKISIDCFSNERNKEGRVVCSVGDEECQCRRRNEEDDERL